MTLFHKESMMYFKSVISQKKRNNCSLLFQCTVFKCRCCNSNCFLNTNCTTGAIGTAHSVQLTSSKESCWLTGQQLLMTILSEHPTNLDILSFGRDKLKTVFILSSIKLDCCVFSPFFCYQCHDCFVASMLGNDVERMAVSTWLFWVWVSFCYFVDNETFLACKRFWKNHEMTLDKVISHRHSNTQLC